MANLRIAELDFDQIKTNLKTFLNSQSEFSDYDFEGSGLSVLIDLLAYNTHYNAYLANMVVNEMFLDSAVKRSSAVSLAKHLGYVPRSVRGARARVNITVTSPTGDPPSLTLNKYSAFNTSINGLGRTFLNIRDYIIIPAGGVYTFNDVELVEGQYFEYSYVSTAPGPAEKFVIPNASVDTSTLTVTVQNSASDTTLTTYTLATDITGVSSSSEVFFLEENAQEKYEVHFGDGVVGKKLTAGNIITVRYLVSNGAEGNISSTTTQIFTAESGIGGSTDITIETESNSSGGVSKEDITSLKFYAPKAYSSQNRIVTSKDYETLIQQNFTKADSINVWGGEENDPPAFGRVFISIKPAGGYIITDDDKNFISNEILSDKSILTVRPIFVDPEYIFVRLNVGVKYDPSATTSTKAGIESSIITAVSNYFITTLQKFNSRFYYSKLVSLISNTNSAIQSTVVGVDLCKRITPALNSINTFELKFSNRLHPATLQTSRFFITRAGETISARIKDVPNTSPSDYNGTGTLQLFNAITGTKISDIGTINYATGVVNITTLQPVGYPAGANDLRISVEVQDSSLDLLTSKNQLLVQDDTAANSNVNRISGITVTATPI